MDSLEQLDEYLDGEIRGACRNTSPLVRIDAFCEEGCCSDAGSGGSGEEGARESADGGRREEQRSWERIEEEGCARSGSGYGGNWG